MSQQWRMMARLGYERWSEFGELAVGGNSIDLKMDDTYEIDAAF